MLSHLLNLLKWPIGLLSISLLPTLLTELAHLLMQIMSDPAPLLSFGVGLVIYWFLDRLLFSRRFMGSMFSTFEHELTHAIFAWLSFHRVQNLKVTWNSGGMIQVVGGHNWTIAIAPYWFPTLCLPFMLMSYLGSFGGAWWISSAFGAAYCYHLLSTYRETHREQTDLQYTSFLFAWLFLPTANLFSAGFVLAFAHSGAGSAFRFLSSLIENYSIPFI